MATLQQRLADLITSIGTDYKAIQAKIGTLANLNTSDKTSVINAINEINLKPTSSGGASIADGDSGTSTTTTYSASKIKALNDAQDATISGKPIIDDTNAGTTKVFSSTKILALNSAQDANAANKVDVTTAQSIGGVKTFTSAPVVPDAAFTILKVSGLQSALDAKPGINDAAATTATTAAAGVWSPAKVTAQIAALETKLLGGVGTAFDTFKELADQLAADESGVAALTTQVNNRLRFDAAQTLTAAQKVQGKANLDAYGALELGNPDADLVALYTTAKA